LRYIVELRTEMFGEEEGKYSVSALVSAVVDRMQWKSPAHLCIRRHVAGSK